jgi:hypothetical protein
MAAWVKRWLRFTSCRNGGSDPKGGKPTSSVRLKNGLQGGGEKGSGRVLLVVLPSLRGGAAEVEGGTACFWGIDFGVEAGLADSVWPGFPAVVAASGGFCVVGGDGGVGGVKAISI